MTEETKEETRTLDFASLHIPPAGLDIESMIAPWSWIFDDENEDLVVVMFTVFGDWIIKNRITNEILFLNTIQGKITKAASSASEFMGYIRQTKSDQYHKYFQPLLVGELIYELKLIREPLQIFTFNTPPTLTNKIDPLDIRVVACIDHQRFYGSFHQQFKQLSADTTIIRLDITPDDPNGLVKIITAPISNDNDPNVNDTEESKVIIEDE